MNDLPSATNSTFEEIESEKKDCDDILTFPLEASDNRKARKMIISIQRTSEQKMLRGLDSFVFPVKVKNC